MIHINIGSNLDSKYGTRFKNISIAINLLIESKLNIKKISCFYETPSYPNKKLPKFANIGLLGEYSFDHIKLIKEISLIEKKIGRVKTKKNDPRVCDIDIIDFNGMNISTKYNNNEIIVPHKSMHKRNFVLLPLYEINKSWIHPKYKKNIVNLVFNLSNLDLRSINLT